MAGICLAEEWRHNCEIVSQKNGMNVFAYAPGDVAMGGPRSSSTRPMPTQRQKEFKGEWKTIETRGNASRTTCPNAAEIGRDGVGALDASAPEKPLWMWRSASARAEITTKEAASRDAVYVINDGALEDPTGGARGAVRLAVEVAKVGKVGMGTALDRGGMLGVDCSRSSV
ncbi:hypothetical protein C8R44DRAFT_739897 [Mycena epipterygia]|nr:hypothetical protein C8R44DRAFT_739897 [Mycena epipterygia]